jgi:hypothetical protein|tara:strand:+ start:11 stop:487 length:477 start_codon:yes stop_codon:yes gene_type:complete
MNIKKKALADQKYRQTEKGFVGSKYVHLSKPSARKQRPNVFIGLTKKEYLEEYYQHKKKNQEKYPDSNGVLCCYCKQPLTFITNIVNAGVVSIEHKKPKRRGLIIETNFSVDRLDNLKGYIKGNTVFCCAGCNNRKNQVNIQDCRNILKVYEEKNIDA